MKKTILLSTICLALLAAGPSRADSLIGEQILLELGVDLTNTNPFTPSFISQHNAGTRTVGDGIEWEGATFDFGADTLYAKFTTGHTELPFNGFRFTLLNPNLLITDISVLSDSGNPNGSVPPVGGYWNVVIDPAGHGFGIDGNGSLGGVEILLRINTRTVSGTVPEAASTFSLVGLTLLGIAGLRRRLARR